MTYTGGGGPEGRSGEPQEVPSCYTHPGRVAGAVCRRCGRPICPDCMREAPVGWQCPSCVRQGARISPSVRWQPRRRGTLGATKLTPFVVALIVVNAAIYGYEAGHPAFEERFWLVPFEVHYMGRWYQLITSAFLHASVEHIALNMITLAIVGPPVEVAIGRLRFGVVYLLAAFGGGVAFYLLAPVNDAGLGASGAIFGVMGAYYVLARSRGWETQTITVLLVINLVFSFSVPGIAWQAHLGGIIVGAAACAGLLARGRRPAGITPTGVAVNLQALIVLIVGVAALAALSALPPGQVHL